MASTSEKTFGQRLEKGRQIAAIISSFNEYAPSNNEINLQNFEGYLQQVEDLNNNVAHLNNILSETRKSRQNIYLGADGLKERCSKIKDYVASLKEGGKSASYKNIVREYSKFNSRTTKVPPTSTSPEAGDAKKKISQSEKSYGSLIAAGRNIYQIITSIPGYAPSNPMIQKDNFGTFLDSVDNLNNEVSRNYIAADKAIKDRYLAYEGEDGLKVKFRAIKSYVASQYGRKSNEYEEINKIKY
jgi:hypothetical protein